MGRGPRCHVSAFCRAGRVFKLRLRLCGADRGGRDVCDCGKSGELVAELARHGNSPFLSIGILVHRRHTGNGGQVRRFAPLVSDRDEARDTAPEPATATRLHRLGMSALGQKRI